ncbi:pentapeptide repeat-containing protein [Sphingobacterium alkalisoli]|uniref:Pentapeptide repeat-containing protein n=1 Tax=Sphingobacterium alkalisoli TaxID=1874115 RepID=A0A4U0H4U3_9SPHI|nr:pentapeptide repeat-containing protein [Sphingobacterium alkalisoli]TJY66715.1 pentapeptide repeat-containing protein [Sphingobacterium alkalisoli]GGH14651.1 hypothetical protein GCM10011418_15740 [Sphingobacterium alkalisoli]
MSDIIKSIFEHQQLKNFDFGSKVLKNCSFTNCTLEGGSFANSKFLNCRFIKCKITNCNFHSSVFLNSGNWFDSIFESNNFSKVTVGNVEIEKVVFLNNNYKETTFDGANLIDIVFEGEITSSWFYGISYAENLYYRNWLLKNKPKPLKKPVINLEKALLNDVIFSRGLDLSQTIFPEQDNLLVISKPKHFFESFLLKCTEIFSDANSIDFCKELVDKVLFRPDSRGMPIVLIDLNIFYPSLNQERDKIIVELLKGNLNDTRSYK